MLYEYLEKSNLAHHIDRRLVLTADVFILIVASICSVLFVGIVAKNLYTLGYATSWIVGSAIIGAITFFSLKTYHSVVRHSSVYEVWRLAMAVLIKNVLLGIAIYIYHHNIGYSFPHLVALLLVDSMASIVLLTLERVLVVVYYDVARQQTRKRRSTPPVLVYGIGEPSIDFLKAYQNKYDVRGFLLYGKSKKKYHVSDHPVYEFDDDDRLSHIIDNSRIEYIVFTSKEDMSLEEERLIRFCQNNKVKMLYMPPIRIIDKGTNNKKREVREVRIEDLLGRSEIELSSDEVIKNFQGKRIMVTGAAGSIGSELCRQLATFGIKELICFDNSETPMHNLRLELEDSFPELRFRPIIGDIRFAKRLEWAFSKFQPQIVFHAGAYKHVPLMEENPCEAVLANVYGSANVADMCCKYGVEKMIMISTDKAVNPTNIMGCTKRLAEIYVQSLGLAIEKGTVEGKTKFVTTRFGNVLGSNGSVIPRFRDQIAKGGPVTVTHPDITRFFMTIPEACRLVMEAATRGEDNQIFVFDMGKSVKIADMARRMIELAGFVPDRDIKIEFTGLRPGEKLYEEVLAKEENTLPTEHKSIRIAKVRQYDYAEIKQIIGRLRGYAEDVDIDAIVLLMKHIVPEFKSKNSIFEKFDHQIEDEIIASQRTNK